MKNLNRILIFAGLIILGAVMIMALRIPSLDGLGAKYDRALILAMLLAVPAAFLTEAGNRLTSKNKDKRWIRLAVSFAVAEAALLLCYKGFGFTADGSFEAPFIKWAINVIDTLAEKLAR